jgi:hypothetical protein
MATYSEMLDRLNTMLSDASDRVYSSSEKGEFLKSAYNDPLVFQIVRDTSLTTGTNDPDYTLPSTINEVLDVLVDVGGQGFPQRIDRSAWEVIGNTLYLDYTQQYIPSGKTIVLIGKQKLTTSDNLPNFLQEYVLHLASIYALEFLKNKFAGRFLKNDVSMTELIAALNTHRQRVQELRKSLANRRSVAG